MLRDAFWWYYNITRIHRSKKHMVQQQPMETITWNDKVKLTYYMSGRIKRTRIIEWKTCLEWFPNYTDWAHLVEKGKMMTGSYLDNENRKGRICWRALTSTANHKLTETAFREKLTGVIYQWLWALLRHTLNKLETMTTALETSFLQTTHNGTPERKWNIFKQFRKYCQVKNMTLTEVLVSKLVTHIEEPKQREN